MKKTLKTPLFPQSRATIALSGESIEIIHALKAIGIETFQIEKNPLLDTSISSHADCNILQLDENSFVCSEHLKEKLSNYINGSAIVNNFTNKNLKSQKVSIYSEKIASPYPNDVKINVRFTKNNVICNTKAVSSAIIQYAEIHEKKPIHCNQGYVGCSSVLVSPNAVMTDDKSVYNCFDSIGFDCLMLSKGQIKLSGYNYGFIGGCCGFVDKNVLAFTGKIDSHGDSNKIKAFLNKYNVKAIELTNAALTDIGGIVPILEEI